MDFALIPFRGLDGAKQRLRDVLSPHERTALAWAMLSDVISAVTTSVTSPQVLIVTRNLSAVRSFVSSDIIVTEDPADAGLNGALRSGFRRIAELAGPATPVLSVAADLPLLRPVTVGRAFAALRADDTLILAPARADGGTNLFGQRAACRVEPAFGLQSYRAHVAAAERAGVAVHVIEDVEAGRDIDRRDDLLALANAPYTTRSVRFARACNTRAQRFAAAKRNVRV